MLVWCLPLVHGRLVVFSFYYLMSLLPVFNSFVSLIVLPSIFLWFWGGLYLSLFFLVCCVFYLLREVSNLEDRFFSAFGVFIASEVIIFLGLFWVAIWYGEGINPISDFMGFPFLGSVLLVTSSFFVTAYHHATEWYESRIHLLVCIFFGFCFVSIQLFEFYFCDCDSFYSSFYVVCFMVTGLHFLHVLFGLSFLSYVFMSGSSLDPYYMDVSVWYWHFVDYVWLWVYLIVYVV